MTNGQGPPLQSPFDKRTAICYRAAMSSDPALTPDTEHRGLLRLLPAAVRPFAQLARFDRPIGWWLLFWPCASGLALAGGSVTRWDLLLWLLLGSIVMRGAGCVYNDIVDRDLDRQVERTANRPLASGALSLRAAWAWLLALCLTGLIVLLQLPWRAQLVALASLLLVAAYPFMKRITWWPQIWLGLVFSWGALVAWLAVDSVQLWSMAALYLGCVCWVIGYDTIYALQDREDDALAGIRSSALRLGDNVQAGLLLFYLAAILLWGLALWWVRPSLIGTAALVPAAMHLMQQVFLLDLRSESDALTKFRANRTTGLLLFAACFVVGQSA